MPAPRTQGQAGHLAHVLKPFANLLFPGFERYLWMDADMWAQGRGFFDALVQGTQTTGMAVPVERDGCYSPTPWQERQWLIRRLTRVYGLRVMLGSCHRPMINTGMFMLEAGAGHWQAWQRETRRVVAATGRAIASDQVALFALMYHDGLPVHTVDAVHNWICSRAVPAWHPARQIFVTPDDTGREITVLHNTSPSRHRRMPVPVVGGGVAPMLLHRPRGRVERSLVQTTPADSLPPAPTAARTAVPDVVPARDSHTV